MATPLCDTVKMTIRTRQDSAICTPKLKLLEIYDSRHVGKNGLSPIQGLYFQKAK